ncbi:phage minor head protein [Pleomorphomonas koreensis]|uniref:phage head morphogenesis protein n=1 Tax=Pleomorphomonas koreensis TaxID=257440 RepID=UPI000403C449|nr:phage minor head protein [Pleomorphomonas koreensis]
MAVVLKPLTPAEAIAAYRRRGQNPVESFSWQDLFEKDHANAFSVAKSAGFDILTDIDKAMTAALAEGKTLDEFSRTLRPVLTDKGWWGRKLAVDPLTGEERVVQLGSLKRLKTIFETNLRVSYAACHWSSFERNKASRPFLRYVAILDERTRPAHRARHNLVLPVDHPYWDTWAPPCGWGCRCTLQSLSQRDVDRLKREGEILKFEPPQDTFRDYVNTRTGEVTRVPDGIDPGWAYNPGKAAIEAMLRRAEKLVTAPPRLAAAHADATDAEAFRTWFQSADRRRPGVVVAGAVSDTVLDDLGRRGKAPASAAVIITRQTATSMAKASAAEADPQAVAELLSGLPSLLTRPTAVMLDRRDGSLVYVLASSRLGTGRLLAVRVVYARKAVKGGQPIQAFSVRSYQLVDRVSLLDLSTFAPIEGAVP